jgi:hypothetical protein
VVAHLQNVVLGGMKRVRSSWRRIKNILCDPKSVTKFDCSEDANPSEPFVIPLISLEFLGFLKLSPINLNADLSKIPTDEKTPYHSLI